MLLQVLRASLVSQQIVVLFPVRVELKIWAQLLACAARMWTIVNNVITRNINSLNFKTKTTTTDQVADMS